MKNLHRTSTETNELLMSGVNINTYNIRTLL